MDASSTPAERNLHATWATPVGSHHAHHVRHLTTPAVIITRTTPATLTTPAVIITRTTSATLTMPATLTTPT